MVGHHHTNIDPLYLIHATLIPSKGIDVGVVMPNYHDATQVLGNVGARLQWEYSWRTEAVVRVEVPRVHLIAINVCAGCLMDPDSSSDRVHAFTVNLVRAVAAVQMLAARGALTSVGPPWTSPWILSRRVPLRLRPQSLHEQVDCVRRVV